MNLRGGRDWRLRVAGAISAMLSLAALVTHAFGWLPMPFFLTFVGVPSVLVLFVLAALAKWLDATVFLRCLAVGIIGGFSATVVYDLSRLVMYRSGLFDYDGFRAIYIFGRWITGDADNSLRATVAGWGYHFWNGMSFGIFYTLMLGRRHWLWGLGYGLVMELCMLGLFPLFLRVTNRVDFVLLSLLGHAFYGATLGMIAQKYALNWAPDPGKGTR